MLILAGAIAIGVVLTVQQKPRLTCDQVTDDVYKFVEEGDNLETKNGLVTLDELKKYTNRLNAYYYGISEMEFELLDDCKVLQELYLFIALLETSITVRTIIEPLAESID